MAGEGLCAVLSVFFMSYIVDIATAMSIKTSGGLSYNCYNPKGDNCSWYTECLETLSPCANGPATYATDLGQTFCKTYNAHYHSLSHSGQVWMDHGSKCLQKTLAAIIRPDQHVTCGQFNVLALAVQAGCFVSKNPSICQLSSTDFRRIFWTLEEELDDSYYWKQSEETYTKALLPTFGQMISVENRCGNNKISDFLIEVIVYNSNGFFNDLHGTLRTWFIDYPDKSTSATGASIAGVAFDVTNQIAEAMSWKYKQLMWFGYPYTGQSNGNVSTNILKIHLAMESENPYDLNAGNIAREDMSAAINDLSHAIKTGRLAFDLGAGTKATLYKVCPDSDCIQSTFEDTPQNTHADVGSSGGNSSATSDAFIGIGVTLAVIVLIVYYFWCKPKCKEKCDECGRTDEQEVHVTKTVVYTVTTRPKN